MKYIIAVDQSTSATKALLIDADCRIQGRVSHAHAQHYPRPGWVEHDAEEIWQNVLTCLTELIDRVGIKYVEAIAISNQRETTVLWDAVSGKPLCPAVVWQDIRARELVDGMNDAADRVYVNTGLTLSPYYPAAKAMHVLQMLGRKEDVRIGTIDSWLIWKLCHRFVTDLSNASRTQLINLRKLQWDPEMLTLFGIKREMLAEEILPSDSIFGTWRGIPVIGVMGDSHAALYGHGCHEAGSAKVTFGTGSSVMLNMGSELHSKPGIQCCIGFADKTGVYYAQEGNITCAGDTLVFLQDIGLFDSPDQIEREAMAADGDGGIQLVPAFSGLGAPYFCEHARGILCGMSRGSTRGQIAYAALCSIAQQSADVISSMGNIGILHADGGPTRNSLLMQLEANLIGCDVHCAAEREMSPMGAAKMAGVTTGLFAKFPVTADEKVFRPQWDEGMRVQRRDSWKQAVRRSMCE